jgi:hypothetical protein
VRISICGFFLAFASLTTPHDRANADQALRSGEIISKRFGYILTKKKWDSPRIAVCWESLPDSTADDRTLVQSAVAGSWEHSSRVRFIGWKECVGTEMGIRIAVRDESPQTLKLGNLLMDRPKGMTLNFTMKKWTPRHCAQGRDACMQAVAIHEFGHALAFSHEQNRPDRPDKPQDWCNETAQGANGDYMTAVYDPASIMNYCNLNWSGKAGLSSIDVEALQAVYGA